MPRSPSHAEFGVGWICALPLELAAATAMLDEVYENLPVQPSDHNTYTLGRIGAHNVVIACLPSGEYGIASAATVAMHMLSSFQSVKIGLLVGIGGGIPSHGEDIRLGDVVVGVPTSSNTHGGVIQYDLGKAGHGDKFKRTGMLNRPPQTLLTAVSKLQAIHQMEGNRITSIMKEAAKRSLALRTTLEAPQREDLLFDTSYTHDQKEPTCRDCNPERIIRRSPRVPDQPMVHYGLIASGNRVVKDSHFRNRLRRDLGACCVDMEAAGLMNNFPCLVVRGICDYADSHKNKDWQGYAAAVAAAYATELLLITPMTIETAEKDNYLRLESAAQDRLNSMPAVELEALKKRVLSSLRPSKLEMPHRGQPHLLESAWDQIFNHHEYSTWYRGEETGTYRGLIWIKGKPGSGKSAFLKHAFSRAVQELQKDGAGVAAFFHPRGQHRQWAQIDLFRIVLYQLLQIIHDDFVDFIKMFGHKFQDAMKNVSWSEAELMSFLKATFTKPRPSRTVIFADGIDECKGDGMRGLAIFFREITVLSNTVDAKLSICLSSREYPKVSIGECPEILIDRLNSSEIQHYVRQKLAMAGLERHLNWITLTRSIIKRSAGVFLWVVIVLDTLLEDWDNGKNFRYLTRRLQEIPPALEKLYEQILSGTKTQDIQMTLKFFYWVILAAKPLRLLEWHHVIAWIREKPPTSLQEWRESDYHTENSWQLERLIQGISRGLVEVESGEMQQIAIDRNSTCGDAGSLNSEEGETRTVRVIHSSVAEFFLRGKGFAVLDPSVRGQALALGHLSILGTCLDYIGIPELDLLAHRRETAILVKHFPAGQKTPSLTGVRSEASFGSSASSYRGSARFEDNTIASEPSTRPVQFMKAKTSVSENIPFALQRYLQDSTAPIDAKAVERGASDTESRYSETVLSQTLQEYPDLLLYIIIAFTFHAKCADRHGGDPKQIIWRLRDKNEWQRWVCLADKFRSDTTLLYFAAERNMATWVKCLLSSRTDPDKTGGVYQYPLLAAVVNKNKETTKLLLKGGADPSCVDKISRSPLHYIAEGGSTEFLDFLMKTSKHYSSHPKLLDARDQSYRTPLHLAVQKGHLSMCEALLRLGVGVNYRDDVGKSALYYAAEGEKSSLDLCRLLLENGAFRAASTDYLPTPAQLALEKGYPERLSLIEDYTPQKDQALGNSTLALEVQLVQLLGESWLKNPYVQVVFAGETKTLYPAQASPGNRPGRERVQFSVPLFNREAIVLHLFEIRGPEHVRVGIKWEVKYIRYKESGEAQTHVFNRNIGDSRKEEPDPDLVVHQGNVTLNVIVPPTVGITGTERVILRNSPHDLEESLTGDDHSSIQQLVKRGLLKRIGDGFRRIPKAVRKSREMPNSSGSLCAEQ